MFERFLVQDFQDIYFGTLTAGSGSYPASRIQKGLVLGSKDRDLSEEGVGFGVPVLKFVHESVFPDSWSMSAEKQDGFFIIKADFRMNLVARMAKKNDIINNHIFCWAREAFSKIHRENPRLRSRMSFLSRILRLTLHLEDTFGEIPPLGFVRVTYVIKGSRIDIELKFPMVNGCTELIVLNEQGANCFDTYKDTEGHYLRGNEIGSWDELNANYASFIDPLDKLSFTLKRIEGARMFRGRELAAGRLSWSGLAYVLSPQKEEFAYSIRMGRL
jgi:hypothetical protein